MFHFLILKSATNTRDVMPMCNVACEEAPGYWTIGMIQYLHMVKMVAKKTIGQGNKIMVVSDNEISLQQLLSETRRSDHSRCCLLKKKADQAECLQSQEKIKIK
jgi:hypothetical protein